MKGMLFLEIESANIQALADTFLCRRIPVYQVQVVDELHIRCNVSRQDYPQVQKLCQDRGDTVTLRHRSGLIWTVKGLAKRPVLILGLIFLLFLANFVSTRVLFIQVEGNVTVPERKILESAGEAGVFFGAERRALRSEQVKNTLLEELPELKWACVNTVGCVATITVRERAETDTTDEQLSYGSIVAGMDGIILSCTATKGNLLCAPGQAVLKGETLISGYTDCGIYIQATRAEGEVYAQTLHALEGVIPTNYDKKTEILSQRKSYSLILGKKRIFLWQSSGISHAVCDRMYEEYYVTLPGSFVLPLALAVDSYTYRDTEAAQMDQDQAEGLLGEFLKGYLAGQMIAGRILSSETEMIVYDSCFCLAGEYLCAEMIGRQQREGIGECNGESD